MTSSLQCVSSRQEMEAINDLLGVHVVVKSPQPVQRPRIITKRYELYAEPSRFQLLQPCFLLLQIGQEGFNQLLNIIFVGTTFPKTVSKNDEGHLLTAVGFYISIKYFLQGLFHVGLVHFRNSAARSFHRMAKCFSNAPTPDIPEVMIVAYRVVKIKAIGIQRPDLHC